MRLILFTVFTLIVNSFASAAASDDLKKLWDIPLNPVEYEIKDVYVQNQNSILVKEIVYKSREYHGEKSQIFAYYCAPTWAKNKLPAIIISHGGGGIATLSGTVLWASRGYAVLALDLPGKGFQRETSRSTGPDMEVPNLLKVQPLEDNYLVHAVAAIRNGITFLTEQPEVDTTKIGLVGLSWGGVLTLLTNGQDERLATAVNVFGAGYIPEASTWQQRFNEMSKEDLALWNKYLDPKNFLKTQHASIFFVTGTNDHCYYLPTFQKSYDEVTVAKKLYLVPNLKHQFMPETQNVVWNWLDDKLKYDGSFPKVTFMSLFKKGDESLIVSIKAEALHSVKDATLYYTLGGPSRWTKREWRSRAPYFEDGVYYFSLPTAMIEPELLFFVNIGDDHGRQVSTPVRSILRVNTIKDEETFAVSSPIREVNVHEPPLKLLGMKEPEFLKIFFSKSMGSYHLFEALNRTQPAGAALNSTDQVNN